VPDDPKTISVAIIEDLREVREWLVVLVDGTRGFRSAGSYRTMEEALAKIGASVPDVVVTDLGLPGMSGTDGIRILRDRYPQLPILALTIFDDDKEVFRALCAGACGYLLKNTPPARLLESLREVFDGGAPMSPQIARRVVTLFRDVAPPERTECRLTPQEKELLRLLVEGHHYKTAADAMSVSYHTVAFHVRNIYAKLEVHSKSEAVARALRDQLV
jgi:DNA-binding NarL/FixJ family response regulator